MTLSLAQDAKSQHIAEFRSREATTSDSALNVTPPIMSVLQNRPRLILPAAQCQLTICLTIFSP